MRPLAYLLTLALLHGGRAAARPDVPFESSPPRAADRGPADCTLTDDPQLAGTLRALRFATEGAGQPIREVRLAGLRAVPEAALWRALGGRPQGVVGAETAAILLARLSSLGVFRTIVPTVRVLADRAVLDLEVEEHPTLRKVVIEGLKDLDPGPMLEVLIDTPSAVEIERSRRPRRARRDRTAVCAMPLPDREWLAIAEGAVLHPGIPWQGVGEALHRVLLHLRDSGYFMASVAAELRDDGTLVVRIDEGRIEGLDLEGVHPRIADAVRTELGVKSGQVFLLADLEAGLDRVRRRFPFLARDQVGLPPRTPLVEELRVPGAPARFRTVPAPERPLARKDRRVQIRVAMRNLDRLAVRVGNDAERLFEDAGELADDRRRARARHHAGEEDDEEDEEEDEDDEDEEPGGRSYHAIRGRRVVVHLEAEQADLDVDPIPLIRHTQAEGFAPGLGASVLVFDPGDRVHLALDAQANVSIQRENRVTPLGASGLQSIAAGERASWMFGPRLRVPALGLSEVGAELHSLGDTADRWRLDALDSYVYSALFNRPEAEYFRRTGASAFATFHLFEQLTAGAEYRYDRYDSLTRLDNARTLFNSDERPFPNPPVDEGSIGSLLLRLEYATTERTLHEVGARERHPETSLVWRAFDRLARTGLRTMTTLELARSALGGVARLAYTRVVHDSVVQARLSPHQQLRVRVRVAGGEGLPHQYQEALGGWNALRGYGFKEFRGGDLSLLGTAEYAYRFLGVFADLGTIHDRGTRTPRLGLGAFARMGPHVHLALAWRTDDKADGVPEVRFFFARPF